MTEREIPDGLGFLFGGMTDDSNTVSAPPAVGEPENSAVATPVPVPLVEPAAAPVFLSRRELRAAGGYEADAAAPAVGPDPSPAAEPVHGGIASLFPLLGDVTVAPLGAPLAPPSPVDAILAPAPVAVPVSTTPPPAAPVPVPVSTIPPVPTPVFPAATVPSAAPDFVAAFGLTEPATSEADSFIGSHRAMRAEPQPTVKPKRQPHGTSKGHPTAERPTSTGPATRNADERKSFRQRIFGVGVMVLVGGLFAVLALPAYADNDASSLIKAENGPTQKLAIADVAASAVTTGSRDAYTATSAADLKKLYSDAIRQQNLAAYMQSGAKQAGDDYPWFAELSRNQGGGLSPLNYYYRECVDFVAWRLNRDAGSTSAPFKWTWSTLTPNGGNASQWKAAWAGHGWASGTTPVVGSVAWFPYNHVAYVAGILNNGQVLVEEYNWSGQHLYSQRVINPGDAYYLYAPS